MTISYIDSNIPTGEEYVELIVSTGWQGIFEKVNNIIHEAISKSWYLICAYERDLVLRIVQKILQG